MKKNQLNEKSPIQTQLKCQINTYKMSVSKHIQEMFKNTFTIIIYDQTKRNIENSEGTHVQE